MNKIIIKELHIHNSALDDAVKYYKRAELLQGRIMVTVNELAAKLNTINEQLDKAKNEIVAQVGALQAALEGVELPQDALDALVALEATAQVLDDLNPDAPVAPVDEPVVEPVVEEPVAEEPAPTEEPAPVDEPVAPADQPVV